MLTLFFCEAAGIMKQQGKPCIAYGSEAGHLDEFMKKPVLDLCSETYFIARSQDSLEIIKELGMNGHIGTDTAWTFKSLDKKEWALTKLKETGWDGTQPLLGIAVINPFWWPIRPSVVDLFKAIITGNWDLHVNKWYFFAWSKKRAVLFDNYIKYIATAINHFAKKRDHHVIIIGMEMLDIDACNKLQTQILSKPAIFSSKNYDGYELTEILRNLTLLVTSRYHARVLSMEGHVPAVAISMDERLDNIYGELGHEKLLLKVDDTKLEHSLLDALDYAHLNYASIKEQIKNKLPYFYTTMEDMGDYFKTFVESAFPGITVNAEVKKAHE